MKRPYWVAIVLLLAPLSGAAVPVSLSLWGAYSRLQMQEVNQALEKVRADIASSGASITKFENLNSGWIAGLDMDWSLTPRWSLGPRVEWLEAVPGRVEATQSPASLEATYGGHLLPLALGIKYRQVLVDRLSCDLGLYGGYGWGSVYQQAKVSVGSLAQSAKVDFAGGAFFGEAEAELQYQTLKNLKALLGLGWRLARIPEMQALASESSFYNVSKGETAVGPDGRALAMDFSGFKVQAGLELSF